MATLAPKLPYTHPFAGGFPYRGSQRLPSDPDALTYLAAVAAADGAPVETAVAVAVDDFFKGCKADGIWDAIKASCILCGARTLAGALVPLVGTAPTNVADGFVAGDYTRGGATPGLKGDGTSCLDSGRASNADPLNDHHVAAYITASASANGAVMGNGNSVDGLTQTIQDITNGNCFFRNHSTSGVSAVADGAGLAGSSRSNASTISVIGGGQSDTLSLTSTGADASNINVFSRRSLNAPQLFWDGTAAFYSIGEALDLEALDARVTALVTAIGAAV